MTIDTKRLATDPDYWRECGAPDDATSYGPDGEGYCPGWYKKDEREDNMFMHEDGGEWLKTVLVPGNRIPRPTPKTASEEWVDGLPPVGCECEYSPAPAENYWDKCVYLAHYNGEHFVLISETGYVDRMSDRLPAKERFRPIRTKQERQRDELADLIADNIEITLENDSFHVGAGKAVEAIIADGWTKP